MSVASALTPLLLTLAGGAAVVLLVLYRRKKRQEKTENLPVDPLSNLFVDREDRQ